jgi:hypothetical protein
MYLPLSFILLVSAGRAALEDYRYIHVIAIAIDMLMSHLRAVCNSRHQVDDREASKEYLVFDRASRTFLRKSSGDIVVGDIVKMVTHNTGIDQSNRCFHLSHLWHVCC